VSLHTKRALEWRTSFGDADFRKESIARELEMLTGKRMGNSASRVASSAGGLISIQMATE
jgi:hypothetical protein